MTDKKKWTLSNFWYILSITIIAITFVITMVRAYDSISRLAEMVEQNPLLRVSLCVDSFKLGESYE